MLNLNVLFLLFSFFSFHGMGDIEPDNPAQFMVKTSDGGYITVSSTDEVGKGKYDIRLVKTDGLGQEEWNHLYGGTSYDRGTAVQQTADGGYIVVGATSSYGVGNYDVFLIKTDQSGNELWKQTYGRFFNDYGHSVEQTPDGGYLITGKTQFCPSNQNFSNCKDELWTIKTDAKGTLVWDRVGQKEE